MRDWAFRAVVGSVVAAGVVTIAILTSNAMLGPAPVMMTLRQVVEDPLTLIALRSPGHRSGDVQMTKPSKPAPRERVLPVVREREPVAAYEGAPAPPPLLPDLAPIILPATQLAPPVLEGPPVVVPVVYPGPTLVGGGGGFRRPPLFTPAGPVPEPATWATMILGLFGVGAILRHARAARAKAAA